MYLLNEVFDKLFRPKLQTDSMIEKMITKIVHLVYYGAVNIQPSETVNMYGAHCNMLIMLKYAICSLVIQDTYKLTC